MQVRIIAFTLEGARTGEKLLKGLRELECYQVKGYTMKDFTEACDELKPLTHSLADWTQRAFATSEAIIFIGATGIAVRAIAPFIKDKQTDPAVVTLDEKGNYSIPILSGHIGGANRLARKIAKIVGGKAIVSTATDLNGLFAVDEWAHQKGLVIEDIKKAKLISAGLLKGETIGIKSDFEIKGNLPKQFQRIDALEKYLPYGIHITTEHSKENECLKLIPKIMVLGIGCKKGTPLEAIEALVLPTLEAENISFSAVSAIGTIDLKQDEKGLLEFSAKYGKPLTFFDSGALKAVEGSFTSSSFVQQITQVDNVCERAAVAASGGKLILRKTAQNGVTLAIAKKEYQVEFTEENMKLYVVGLGPGGQDEMTPRAIKALEESDVIAGYDVYIDLIRDQFTPKKLLTTPMKREVERCQMAVDEALKGQVVSMICSGDAGVYGMAGIMHEIAKDHKELTIEVIPGITAACSAAAVLGAPLIHDFAIISLSDLLTPWEKIEKRLYAAGMADFVVCLYNPSSKKRADYLQKACDILLKERDENTPCGYVRNIGRDGEMRAICTLKELRDTEVDMFTTVIIGNSETTVIHGKLVTPRGYKHHEK